MHSVTASRRSPCAPSRATGTSACRSRTAVSVFPPHSCPTSSNVSPAATARAPDRSERASGSRSPAATHARMAAICSTRTRRRTGRSSCSSSPHSAAHRDPRSMSLDDRNATEIAQLALLGEAADHITGVGIFVWDDDRNYVAVNQTACRLVGRKREELLAMKVGDMTEDRAAPYFDEVQHGGLHTGSLTIDRPDGPVEIDWITTRTRVAGLPYM